LNRRYKTKYNLKPSQPALALALFSPSRSLSSPLSVPYDSIAATTELSIVPDTVPRVLPLSNDQYSNIHSKDGMEDIIHDIGQDSFQQAHMCDSLKDYSKIPFYPDCSSFTRLLAN